MDAWCAFLLGGVLVASSVGCGDASGDGTGGAGTGNGGAGGAHSTGSTSNGGGGNVAPLCSKPTAVPCSSEVAAQLTLKSTPSKAAISNEAEDIGWVSHVDASDVGVTDGSGSFVYGTFTADGLQKVNISDIDALSWFQWDIAFHRYVVRINGDNSGPSCVQAARVPGSYQDVAAIPDELAYVRDDFFTDACSFVASPSGPAGSPATALAPFASYEGCLKTTGQVFVVQLADGHHLKLVIDSYYEPDVQSECNATGSGSLNGPGAGNFLMRWAFLD